MNQITTVGIIIRDWLCTYWTIYLCIDFCARSYCWCCSLWVCWCCCCWC